jgi:signal transduction histidine kinase
MRFFFTIFASAILCMAVRGQGSSASLENILLRSTEESLHKSYDSIHAIVDTMEFAEAVKMADKLLRVSAGLPHCRLAFMEMTRLMYSTYQKSPNYKQVLLYYISIAEEPVFNKPEIQQTILTLIATFYYGIGDYDNAKYYYLKYLEIHIEDIPGRKINIYTTIGLIYREKSDYAMAIFYMQQACNQAVLENDIEWIGLSSGNLGETYYLTGKYSEAIPLLLKDVRISIQKNSFESAAGSFGTLGAIYLKLKNSQKAKECLDSSVYMLNKVFEKTEFSRMRSKTYKYMADYYVMEGDFDKGHHYLAMAWNINDSITLRKNRDQLNMQVHEMNAARNRQKEMLLKTTIENKKRNELLFAVFIVAIILLLAFTFLLLKQKQRINTVLKERNQSVVKQKLAVEERENELARSNETKNKLFSIIAHDLRTPVGNLHGLLSLINAGIIQKDALEEHLPGITAKVETLSNTIDNLLNWTYAQMDGISINKDRVQLHALVNKVFEFLDSSATKKKIALLNHVPKDMLVLADMNQLEIVVRNLVSNAIKFSHENSSVTVDAEIKDGKAITSISDFGVGISKETMEKLFNPHDGISTTGTNGEKGVGLGLVICKEFIANNDGRIWTGANAPSGSVFKFELTAV